MDKSLKHCAEWKKADTEEYTPSDSLCVKVLNSNSDGISLSQYRGWFEN